MNSKKLLIVALLFLVIIAVFVYVEKPAKESKYEGKTWLTIGDSITYLNGYQPIVNQTFNFGEIKNYGKSAFTTEMLVDEMETWPKNAQLVTFFAGTNDFGQNVDLNTTKQSVDTIFRHLKEKYPKSDIVVILPSQRWGFKRDPVPEPTMTNSKGNTLEQYCDVIEESAKKYKLPTIDLYHQSGITKDNIDTYTKDGLHPNKKGFKKIAQVMSDFLGVYKR
ncbi:SGNH/GDSL hydrolase family protein [Fictibacillus barbaricus]|uniref:Lysophospholipase L1-like esterase n=1 Tax=Fictibacillus barbaricus TaxID=182136 RepID=A0ABU1U1I1_9BACL|nr:SGNH/GDSL hydrolase family protein [Fictibacillus barbaricus]MDR7073302.1 lysophospholipase L1-like esterase [Fictibacillus barbaricus]